MQAFGRGGKVEDLGVAGDVPWPLPPLLMLGWPGYMVSFFVLSGWVGAGGMGEDLGGAGHRCPLTLLILETWGWW